MLPTLPPKKFERLNTVKIPINKSIKRNIPHFVSQLYTLNNQNVSKINFNTELALRIVQRLEHLEGVDLERVNKELSILKKVLPSIKARDIAIAKLTEHVQLLKTGEQQKQLEKGQKEKEILLDELSNEYLFTLLKRVNAEAYERVMTMEEAGRRKYAKNILAMTSLSKEKIVAAKTLVGMEKREVDKLLLQYGLNHTELNTDTTEGLNNAKMALLSTGYGENIYEKMSAFLPKQQSSGLLTPPLSPSFHNGPPIPSRSTESSVQSKIKHLNYVFTELDKKFKENEFKQTFLYRYRIDEWNESDNLDKLKAKLVQDTRFHDILFTYLSEEHPNKLYLAVQVNDTLNDDIRVVRRVILEGKTIENLIGILQEMHIPFNDRINETDESYLEYIRKIIIELDGDKFSSFLKLAGIEIDENTLANRFEQIRGGIIKDLVELLESKGIEFQKKYTETNIDEEDIDYLRYLQNLIIKYEKFDTLHLDGVSVAVGGSRKGRRRVRTRKVNNKSIKRGGSRKGRRRTTSKKFRKRGNNKSKKVNKGSGSKKSNKKNNVN